jgi:glycosyltransferase involved in cell wall biosynthesis
MKRLRVGFIMPTEVGWRTQYLNWRNGLTEDLGIDPEWIVITWWKEGGFIERLPLVPGGVKARARAQIEMRSGLAHGPFDALFVGSGHTLHGGKGILTRQPYFLNTDVTPKQLHAFGDLYGITETPVAFYERRKHAGWCERYRNAAALFPWSHWAADSLVNDYGVDADSVHVIPPGVDMELWKSPPRDHTGPVNILFVGGQFRRKGGDLLLDWATNTRTKDWILHLVTRDMVVPTHENVRVYNRLSSNDPELMELYRKAHLFVLPTRGDCYSIASIEAMAAGLPVILSLTGGTGDVIKEGETGFLVPPNDGAALAERIDYLITNPGLRAQMGAAARADAERRYNATANVRETVRIMREELEANDR